MAYHTYKDIRNLGYAFDYRVPFTRPKSRRRKALCVPAPALLDERTVRHFDVQEFLRPKLEMKPSSAVNALDKITYSGFMAPGQYPFTETSLETLFGMPLGTMRFFNFQKRDLANPLELLILGLFWVQHALNAPLILGKRSAYFDAPYNVGVKEGVLLGRYNQNHVIPLAQDFDFEAEFKTPRGEVCARGAIVYYCWAYQKTIIDPELRGEIQTLTSLLAATCESEIVNKIASSSTIHGHIPTRMKDNYVMTERTYEGLLKMIDVAEHPVAKLYNILVPNYLTASEFQKTFKSGFRLDRPRAGSREFYKQAVKTLRKGVEECF